GIDALVAGRRRRAGRLRRLARLAVRNLLDPLLRQALLALELLAFGADLLQLLTGEPPLLFGLRLPLALGEIDLLLALPGFLFTIHARALGLGVATHFLLVDRRRLGHPLLRGRTAIDHGIFRHRFGQWLRWRHHIFEHRLGQR